MSKHVLILGAGIIGMCSAHFLLERGYRVTIVDRSSEQHQGCSFGNAGLVVPSHITPLAAPGMIGAAARMMLNPRTPFYIRPRLDPELLAWAWKFTRAATARHVERCAPLLRDLNLASVKCYEELVETIGSDVGFTKSGLLILCKKHGTLEEEAHTAGRANALGIAAQVLDPIRTAELEPNLKMDVVGSVFYPGDCRLVPDRLMRALRCRLRRAGASFHWETEITGWRRHNEVIEAANMPAGAIHADEFVICGGAWSPAAARDLGVKLPMQAGKGYSLTLDSPPRIPRTSAILAEARVAVTPMDGRLRFAGTMEIAGFHERINPARVQGIIESISEYFREFTCDDFAHVTPWCGLRPCSPDGLPYLGRTRLLNNLTIACGHAMMGISLGPITGKLVSQIVSSEPPSIDVALLNPDRYL